MTPNMTTMSSTTQPVINTGNTGRSKASSAENTTSTAPVNTDGGVRDASTTDAVTANAPSATPQTTLTPTASTPQLLDAVGALNTSLRSLQKTNLQFSIDDKSGEPVVKVMDVEKEEVIRQIPPEEVLALVAFFKEAEAKKSQGVELATLVGRGSATGSAVPEGLLLRTQA